MFKAPNTKKVGFLLSLMLFSILVVFYACKKIPRNDGCIDKSRIKPYKVCPKNYDPVCGCDGKEYANACEADKNGVIKYTRGKCKPNGGGTTECFDKSKYNPNALCPQVYDPVCGCDGKEYGNSCEAEKMGIVKYTKGKCKPNGDPCFDKSKYDPNKSCPEIYQPVCGCDGKNYDNPCEAEKMGVVRYTKGKCSGDDCFDKSKYDPNKSCPEIYEPVCGCDGKDYDNPCEAQKMGIVKYTKGKCNSGGNTGGTSDCFDKSKYDPNKSCPEIFQPVCGCDGKTYDNPCEAEKMGIVKYTQGKCR
jgi:hypothetical protein